MSETEERGWVEYLHLFAVGLAVLGVISAAGPAIAGLVFVVVIAVGGFALLFWTWYAILYVFDTERAEELAETWDGWKEQLAADEEEG